MSSTTTTTRVAPTRTVDTVLTDYELHHSGGHGSPADESLANRDRTPRPQPNWDTTHRRVPPYRPINRHRDPLETRVYTSTAEQVFVGVMFTGVSIIATSAKMWHGTFGRVNDGIFRYRIGGEL